MGEEKDASKEGRADKYFEKASAWLGERISRFVSFLFLLFFAGAIYGAVIVSKFPGHSIYLLGAPALLALVAYYNRIVAAVLFAGLVMIFVL